MAETFVIARLSALLNLITFLETPIFVSPVKIKLGKIPAGPQFETFAF